MLNDNLVRGLKSFLTMLNLPQPPDGKPVIEYAVPLIKNALDNGAVAREAPDNYTPLMLYAYFDIDDERLDAELQKGADYITQNIPLKWDGVWNKRFPIFVTALTFAMLGSEKVLKKLYELKCFSQESLDETAFLAASETKVNSFKFLCERGINPFQPMTSMQYNALHIACIYGDTDIVQVILTTNPHEEQLNMLTAQGDTAAALAVNTGHDDCKDLLQKNKQRVWLELTRAFESFNLQTIKTILESNPQLALWHADYDNRAVSLFSFIIPSLITERLGSHELYNYCEAYINAQSPSVQINSFLLALAEINSEKARLSQERQWHQNINSLTQLFYDKLIKLEPYYDTVKTLIFDGINADSKQIGILVKILELNQLKQLDLAYNLDMSPFINRVVNFMHQFLNQLLSALCKNTSLQDCNL
jgi:hypothetical protein